MMFPSFKAEFSLEGLMPERALLRLRRADVILFHVKKTQKNKVCFCVKRKDIEKVFAIYPKMCYNRQNCGAYKVEYLGAVGVGKYAQIVRKRMGLLLGGLLGFSMILASEPLVFQVDFVGTDVYARETYQALESAGIKPFRFYRAGNEDLVCAKLLALDGVEYCSLKKEGHRLIVETRLSPFSSIQTDKGLMQATHTGKITAMTVLRGSPLKGIGDTVQKGETLVGNWFSTEDGGQVRVEIIARVCITCTYTVDVEAADEEGAFAKAYLDLNLTKDDKIETTAVEKDGDLYRVTIAYTAIERLNF